MSKNIHLQPLGRCQSLLWPSLLRRQPATQTLESHWYWTSLHSGLPSKQIHLVNASPALDVTDLPLLSLKPAPLCDMLQMYSFPSPASCPPLPGHCTHAVLALVWAWAHSEAADLHRGHGLAAFGKSPPQTLQPMCRGLTVVPH